MHSRKVKRIILMSDGRTAIVEVRSGYWVGVVCGGGCHAVRHSMSDG